MSGTAPETQSFPVTLGATVEGRREAADRLRSEHAGRVPMILAIDSEARLLALQDNSKLLIRDNMTVGGFLITLRKRLKLQRKGRRLYFQIGKEAPFVPVSLQATLGALYADHKADDGFLYVMLSSCRRALPPMPAAGPEQGAPEPEPEPEPEPSAAGGKIKVE
jgi:hypothetical protein